MHIKDGIAYADDPTPILHVMEVRALSDYHLWLRFNDGATRIFDFTPLLRYPAFNSLQDQGVFERVTIDYGTVVWNDGEIDIAPEYLYDHGVEPVVET